jgi:hypothetical protein
MEFRKTFGRSSGDARRMAGPPVTIYRQRPGEGDARRHDPLGVVAHSEFTIFPSRGLMLSA